uniref:Uncharacterized protein n=1 Tax=Setaria italica TaxID=4555 RepID=K3YFT8_SETIT
MCVLAFCCLHVQCVFAQSVFVVCDFWRHELRCCLREFVSSESLMNLHDHI